MKVQLISTNTTQMFYKYLIFSFLTGVLSISSFSQSETQFCVPDRFGNQYIFSESEVIIQTDIEYGLSQTVDGTWQAQLMDVYTPDPALDTMSHRPLAVILHGGGFKTGDKTDYLVTESMLALARSGYTAVTFNYRLGYDELSGPCSADVDDIHRAAYRALQDANAAMRFLFHNADLYGIDTTFVFVGGVSAGGTLSALLHYATPAYFNENFSFLPLELGPMNTSGNPLDEEFSIDGLVMAWGSFPPYLDITVENVIPVIAFHGAADDIVPIGDGTFDSCPNYPVTVGPDVYIQGVEMTGTCYDFNRDPSGGHSIEIYGEFYIKNRTMCFMKSLMCNECVQTQQDLGSPICPDLGALSSIIDIADVNDVLRVVPNPTQSNNICIRSNMEFEEQLDIRLLDVRGKELSQLTNIQFNSSTLCLDDIGLESGFYFIDIRTPTTSLGQLRFVIE